MAKSALLVEVVFYVKAFIILGVIAAAVNFLPMAYNYAYNPQPGDAVNSGPVCYCIDCKCWPMCNCRRK